MKYLFILSALLCHHHLSAQQVQTFENLTSLVPEGIAIHPDNGTIFISSIAQKKIVRITADGKPQDFIQARQDGFLEGLGMKVDSKRNILWALSNSRNDSLFTSQIHGFNFEGKSMHHFRVSDTVPRLFNDLVIHPSGSLLITDTYQSTICQYNPESKKMDVLVQDTSSFRWPNGMDMLDEKNLVVATYGNGIVNVNLESKRISALSGFKDKTIAFGLDGLVVNGDHLYGIFNAGRDGYPSNAVIRYTLDLKKKLIVSETTIDKGNPAFADPTTAALYGNKIYVIANSHLDQYNANKESVNGIEKSLKPLSLMIYPL